MGDIFWRPSLGRQRHFDILNTRGIKGLRCGEGERNRTPVCRTSALGCASRRTTQVTVSFDFQARRADIALAGGVNHRMG
jgi:hypothetical protein